MFRKKHFLIFIVTFIFSLIFMSRPIYAAENYKIWNTKGIPIVDSTKKWSITFNREISLESCKTSINVYKENTNEKIDLDFSSNIKTISISPKTAYENGKSYTLIVDENLKSIDGKKIKQPVKFTFKINDIQNQSNIINNYNEFYSAIKKSLSNYDSSITLKINNYDKNVYNLEGINKVLLDNPNLRSGYSEASGSIADSNPVSFSINFKYNDTRDNLIKKESQVEQKVTEIVNKVVKTDMKDYEKELALHDYLVNNAQYDKRLFTGNMPDESYTAYGVLINGTGVCEGYAEAMNRLLIAAGIDSKMVIGEANDGNEWIEHAWNIVKIGGQYYQLDSTWDDPVTDDGSNVLRHSYFNITDNQISKDHKWNKADYPECNSTTYNFNNLNVVERDDSGNIITVVKSYNEFYSAIKNAITSGKVGVSLKVLNYDENVYNVSDALTKISNETRLYKNYRWSYYSDDISNSEYISISFN